MKVRPPITEGVGVASCVLGDIRSGKKMMKDDLQVAILSALVGIGEMLQEMRPDWEVDE